MNLKSIKSLFAEMSASDTAPLRTLIKYAYYRFRGKNILAHQNACIKGLRNIQTNDHLRIGISYAGFIHKSDKTYLNVQGKLVIKGAYDIGRGCRFDIGNNAICSLGRGYVTADATFIVMHGLEIGEGSAIAWRCLFLDDDFHSIDYQGKIEKKKNIIIGNHVWIGANSTILKGVHIPDNCIIAANSILTHSFYENNVLIAGNPARIIKKNVYWK